MEKELKDRLDRIDQKQDDLLEGMQGISDDLGILQETQEELVEKVHNLNLTIDDENEF